MTKNVKLIGVPENNFLRIFILASPPGVHTFFCLWRVNKKLPQGETSQNAFQRSRSINLKWKIYMLKWAYPPLMQKIALISEGNDFSLIPFGNVLHRGKLQIDAINSNFENFESALYMRSVSMPLIGCIDTPCIQTNALTSPPKINRDCLCVRAVLTYDKSPVQTHRKSHLQSSSVVIEITRVKNYL